MRSRLRFFAATLLAMPAVFASGRCKTTPVTVSISPAYSYGGASASAMIYPDSSGGV